MTSLDNLAHSIGFVVIASFGIAFILALIAFPFVFFYKRTWKHLSTFYDFYVLKWWLDSIKKSGRTIPTKKNIDAFFKDIEE